MTPLLVFRFSVFWGFPGSGTSPGGFFGKIQYRTTRFCGVSCPHVLQTWYGRFFAQSLANSKVQIWGKKGREKIRVLKKSMQPQTLIKKHINRVPY